MSEIYVVTSGKGGVGKTTTTANIGVGFAMRGKSVVLIDTDTGLRNLDLLLGLENRIMYDLVDVTSGHVPRTSMLPPAVICAPGLTLPKTMTEPSVSIA